MGDIGGDMGDGDRVSETSSLPSSETDVIGESDSRDTFRVVSCTSKLVDGCSSGVLSGIGRAGRD